VEADSRDEDGFFISHFEGMPDLPQPVVDENRNTSLEVTALPSGFGGTSSSVDTQAGADSRLAQIASTLRPQETTQASADSRLTQIAASLRPQEAPQEVPREAPALASGELGEAVPQVAASADIAVRLAAALDSALASGELAEAAAQVVKEVVESKRRRSLGPSSQEPPIFDMDV